MDSTLQQLFNGDTVRLEVGANEEDLLTATTYLSAGIFIAVLAAVFIANKLS